jgi:ribosomal protein L29
MTAKQLIEVLKNASGEELAEIGRLLKRSIVEERYQQSNYIRHLSGPAKRVASTISSMEAR